MIDNQQGCQTTLCGLFPGGLIMGLLLSVVGSAITHATDDGAAGIIYAPPLLGSAGVVVGAGSRGARLEDLALCALAPDHVALSSRPAPTLYWLGVGTLPTAPRLRIGIAGTGSTLLETTLPVVDADGIHRLALGEYGVELREDVDYRWALSLPVSRIGATETLRVSGYIRYRQVSPRLSARLSGLSGAELPAVYAGAGYWYDAIWLLSELIRANPGEPRFRRQRLALLESVPLPAVIAHDRQALSAQ